MDPLSFLTPSRIRVLLVPVGNITEERFRECVAVISETCEVHLSDIPGTESNVFNPMAFPSGRLFYDYQVSINDQESIFLYDFEPYRKTFIVIGIAQGVDPNAAVEDNEGALEQLYKIYKTPILHTIIAFNDSEPKMSDNQHIFHHHSIPASNIETIICDISKLFLDQLSSYLTSYQHITLRSPSTPSTLPSKLLKQKKRISSGSSISISLTDPSSNKISLTSATERRQARVKGRQAKIMGNLYLLSGHYTEALKEFNEAVGLLNVSSDHLWLASVHEGVAACLVLLNYVEVQFQFPAGLNQMLVISPRKKTVIGTQGLTQSQSPTPMTSPRNSMNGGNATINTSTAGLHSDQLWSMYCVPEAVSIIIGKAIQYYETSKADVEDAAPDLVYCEAVLRFLKFLVVGYAANGFDSGVLAALVKDHTLSQEIINREKDLKGLWDREAIYRFTMKINQVRLKDLDLLSQSKIYSSLASVYYDLNYERKRAFVIRQLLISLIPELSRPSSTPSSSSSSPQLLQFLNSVLVTYGVNREPEAVIADFYGQSRWPQLHKSLIVLCITLCEKTHSYQDVLMLKSLLLTRYLDTLTDNDQNVLLNDIKTLSRNHDVQISYFDPFVIRGLKVLPPGNPPVKQSCAAVIEKKNKDDPFIYNPFEKNKNNGDTEVYLVQDEYVEFQLSLQNPFAFPLQINSIEIENFEVLKNHFSVPAKSNGNFTILSKAVDYGQFEISKIKVKLFNFSPKVFKLAQSFKCEVLVKTKDKKEDQNDRPIIVWKKYHENIKTNKIEEVATLQTLKLQVIPSQPTLQLITPPDQLLLLEGQVKRTALTLKNNSNVPITHLNFTMRDSTIPALHEILGDKNMPHSDIYEVEFFIFKESVIIKNPITALAPNEEVTLQMDVIGKRGMENITMLIDYGYKPDGFNEIFTRSLEIPIIAVVNPSLELAGCDILAIPQSVDGSKGKLWAYLADNQSEEFVLFVVDLRNTWNKFLAVDIDFEGFAVNDVIVPLETKRFILPMRKFSLSEDDVARRIPRLSQKQYIIPKISKSEDQFQKEAFWYREALLSKIKGKWSIDSKDDVCGEIEYRGIRLSQKMINLIKLESITIEISLKDVEFTKSGPSCHVIETDSFFNINVSITNNSGKPISGILRNIPTVSNLSALEKRLLYNGSLQHILERPIEPGEKYDFEIAAVILERGEYEWGAMLDVKGEEGIVACKRALKLRGV